MRRLLFCTLVFVVVSLVCLLPGCNSEDCSVPTQNNTPTENIKPVISGLSVDPSIVYPGDQATLLCQADDPDGENGELIFTWGAESGEVLGSDSTAVWTSPYSDGTYSVWVTVTDTSGGSASDTVTVDVLSGTLLVRTSDGLTAVDFDGNSFVLHESTSDVELLGTRIFMWGGGYILELDDQGNEIGTISISNPDVSGYFTMHPDGGFSYNSNNDDVMHFMEADGTWRETVAMPDSSPDHLQNIDGVVVDGNLILSETGNNQLIRVDLTTLEASIFRTINDGGGWLGAIDYYDGEYYLCRSRVVHHFTEAGEVYDLCTVPDGNITGIVCAGSYAFVVINFEGDLYRIDRATGEYELILSGLGYPQDIEYYPTRIIPIVK